MAHKKKGVLYMPYKKLEINVPLLGIGCGQCGSNMLAAGNKLGLFENSAGINTTTSDEMALPESNQIHCLNPDNPKRGAGKDATKGAELFRDSLQDVVRPRLGLIFGRNSTDSPYMITAAMGGGSGNGIAPLLARTLRQATDQPILGLMTLPEDSFLDPLSSRNVLVGLQEFSSSRTFDTLFFVDNNKIYKRLNEKNTLAAVNELVWKPFQHTLSYVGKKSTATMDVEDFERLIRMGRCGAIYEIDVPESQASTAEMLREYMLKSWSNDHHFYPEEYSNPERLLDDKYTYGTGLLIACAPNMFNKHQALFERFYAELTDLLPNVRSHRGFVTDESLVDKIRIITIVTGLPYPMERISEIKERFEQGSKTVVDDTPNFLDGLDRRALVGQQVIRKTNTESFSILSLAEEEIAPAKENDSLLLSPLFSSNKPKKKRKGLNFAD